MEKLVSIFAYAPRAVQVGILVSAVSLLIFLALAVALHRPPSAVPPATTQQSQGANSPSIVGNNNTITYGAAASEKRPPTLTLRQHFSRGTPEGITEIFIFTNDGERATGILDIRVLDDELTQVISYRGPLDTIAPHLPANIEPGHAREFTAKITAHQIARAKWVEWQWEGITNRAPWHATDTFESVAEKTIAREEVDAIVQKLKVRQEYQQHKGGAITKGITFTNDTNMSVAVLDVRVLDASSAEIVNFRRPHGRITPALPLNVEPRHAIQITVELTQDQTERGAWLEWEETGGDKPRVPWTHRDVSVELAPVNARAEANTVTAGTGGSAPAGSADPKQGKGERK